MSGRSQLSCLFCCFTVEISVTLEAARVVFVGMHYIYEFLRFWIQALKAANTIAIQQ